MKNKRSACRRAAGFSVPELLVALAVAGVVAATAIPSLGSLLADHRRSAVVNELLATLVLARMEAVKRNQTVVVCGFVDANGNQRLDDSERGCGGLEWSAGWFVAGWNDANGDGTIDPAELAVPLLAQTINATSGVRVRAPTFTAGAPPAGSAVFRPMRRHSSNGTFTLCDGRGSEHARGIIVSPTGRSRATARRPDGSSLACPAP